MLKCGKYQKPGAGKGKFVAKDGKKLGRGGADPTGAIRRLKGKRG